MKPSTGRIRPSGAGSATSKPTATGSAPAGPPAVNVRPAHWPWGAPISAFLPADPATAAAPRAR